jgi:hypothetical protein
MIPKKPAPGHSRPKNGVASLAYSRPKDGVASLAYDPGVGTGFPPSRSPLLPARSRSGFASAKAGRRAKARSEKIMLKQKV